MWLPYTPIRHARVEAHASADAVVRQAAHLEADQVVLDADVVVDFFETVA